MSGAGADGTCADGTGADGGGPGGVDGGGVDAGDVDVGGGSSAGAWADGSLPCDQANLASLALTFFARALANADEVSVAGVNCMPNCSVEIAAPAAWSG